MAAPEFTRLVDAHYEALYRFALSLARHPADAADLTQQTFYVWARKGETLRDPARAKTWLFTTLYREFLRGRTRSGRSEFLEDLPEEQADPPGADVDLALRLDASMVVAALQDLAEPYRVPLTLFYLEELSYTEIAELLEVPIGTVMSRLSRSKTLLREALAQRQADARVVSFNPQHRKAS